MKHLAIVAATILAALSFYLAVFKDSPWLSIVALLVGIAWTNLRQRKLRGAK